MSHFSRVLLALLLSCASAPIYADCGSLTGTSTSWVGGTGDWNTGSNWDSGIPNSMTNACITNTGGLASVSLAGSVNSLQIGAGNSLTINDNTNFTLSGSSIILTGSTMTQPGTLSLGSTSNGVNLILDPTGATTTLSGGGTLSLGNNATNRIYTNLASATLVNSSGNTIQGSGQLGDGTALAINNQGTIDTAGQTVPLTISTTGGLTNTGTIQVSGGTLNIQGTTVNNTGGLLLWNNAGTINLSGSTINGGDLNGGPVGGMLAGGATLNGVTFQGRTVVTVQDGTITTLQGTLASSLGGALMLDSTGSTTEALISGTVTLNGTVKTSSETNNLILGNGATLAIGTGGTILGSGVIGNAGTLALQNAGTINADQAAGLTINPTGTFTNTGTLEATIGQTVGGTLNLQSSITNTGGTIVSSGTGSLVNLAGSTITGGTLTTTNGGVIENDNVATLNGVTISSGSTVTTVNGAATTLQGTITNNGTLALSSTGSTTEMIISGNVTLTGTGTLTLSDNANNIILGNAGTETLTNGANHTIQGAGQIGDAALSQVINNGTILANDSNALTIDVAGTSNAVANNGTLQVNAGSKMVIVGNLSNFSGGTLTGGTYSVFGTATATGTLQIDSLGTTGGEIVTDAAMILLNGTNAQITDGAGLNALSKLSNVMSGSTFSIGSNFNTGALAFSNAGTVDIAPGVIFSVNGGIDPYNQTGGITQNDGTLEASLNTVSGGLFKGTGITHDLRNSGGTVKPGDSPGTLAVNGDYTQLAAGVLEIEIQGLNPGADYDVLDVTGSISLAGTLDLEAIGGFSPASGESFFFLDGYTSRTGMFSTVDTSGLDLAPGLIAQILYDQGPQSNEVELLIGGQVTGTPEPGTWWMFVTGVCLLAWRARRRNWGN